MLWLWQDSGSGRWAELIARECFRRTFPCSSKHTPTWHLASASSAKFVKTASKSSEDLWAVMALLITQECPNFSTSLPRTIHTKDKTLSCTFRQPSMFSKGTEDISPKERPLLTVWSILLRWLTWLESNGLERKAGQLKNWRTSLLRASKMLCSRSDRG